MIDLTLARSRAAVYGYKVVERLAHKGAPITALGWTDHITKTCFVYNDRCDNVAALIRKVALHEVGHARWKVKRRTPAYWRSIRRFTAVLSDQRVEEDYCEVYSKSIKPEMGIGYSLRAPVPSKVKLAWLRMYL